VLLSRDKHVFVKVDNVSQLPSGTQILFVIGSRYANLSPTKLCSQLSNHNNRFLYVIHLMQLSLRTRGFFP
jgi:hypothetical protein